MGKTRGLILAPTPHRHTGAEKIKSGAPFYKRTGGRLGQVPLILCGRLDCLLPVIKMSTGQIPIIKTNE